MPTAAANLTVGDTVGFGGKRYLVTMPADHADGDGAEPILVEISIPTQPGIYHPGQGNGTYVLLLDQNGKWYVLDSAAKPLTNPLNVLTPAEVAAIPDISAIFYFKDPA